MKKQKNTDTKILLVIQAGMIMAKMAGVISWPWVWVIAPAWGYLAFLILWFFFWYWYYMRN